MCDHVELRNQVSQSFALFCQYRTMLNYADHCECSCFYLLDKIYPCLYCIQSENIYPCIRVYNVNVQNMKRVIAGAAVSRDAGLRVHIKLFLRASGTPDHFKSGSFFTLAIATNAVSFGESNIPKGPLSQSQHVR